VKSRNASPSTQALTRYFRVDGPIPTPRVLESISSMIGVPWPIAFWHAGYHRELLAALHFGSICVLHLLPSMEVSGSGVHLTPGERRTAAAVPLIEFALRAFPVDPPLATLADYDFDAPGPAIAVNFLRSMRLREAETAFARRRLRPGALNVRPHPALLRAADLLDDDFVAAVTRRQSAGLYVAAWAEDFDSAAVAFVRQLLTSQISSAHCSALVKE